MLFDFQLVGHGVSPDLIEQFKVDSKEFFELPMDQKMKFWQTPDDIEGFGQTFVASEERKLSWAADKFALTILPLQLRRPHLLPLLPLPFRYNTLSELFCVFLVFIFGHLLQITVDVAM